MRKKWLSLFLVVLVFASTLLAGGCNGKVNMVTGTWKEISTGDETGGNQQDSSGSGLPFTMYYDVYPDGRVAILFGSEEIPFGKYTMDRDTFKFKSDDGKSDGSGQFTIDMNAKDESTGESYIKMTVFLDNQPVSIVLRKMLDYAGMVKYLKSQTTAPAASAMPATPAPTTEATPAPSAS